MKKRLIFMIIVLVGVWAIAVYFLLSQNRSSQVRTNNTATEYQIQPLKRRLSQEELGKIQQLVSLAVERMNLFDLYVLHLQRETVNSKMLSSLEKLGEYQFAGFLIGESEKSILLARENKILSKNVGEIIDERYLILHVASFGLLVLDVNTGNLLTIR